MILFKNMAARRWLARSMLLPALTAALTAWQRPPESDEMLRRLVQAVQVFYQTTHPEKAYLRLDKDVYTAGETIWLAASVVVADTHRPDTLSRVLHVELLNARNQLIGRRHLVLAGGFGAGELALPDTLTSGTYTLRAYTSWMRNAGPDFFFSRRLSVWPAAPATPGAASAPTPALTPAGRRATAAATAAAAAAAPTPDVQFFPEGGSLVGGVANVVAFKATDYAGRGLEVSGQVLQEQGRSVGSFGGGHLGMGSFAFVPVAGQRYYAAVSVAGLALRVALPEVQASGYTLRVDTQASDFVVRVGQQGPGGGPVLLLGQVRGTVAYVGRGQVTGSEGFSTRIPKAKFPTGIVQFTLFDEQGRPLAERLAFAQHEPALRLRLTPDRASYGPRQPVRLQLAVTDAAGQPVAARLSLAVTDAGAVGPGAETLASHLLLTSDLTGYVENPGYYFQNPTPETARHLDALLLTQGWRRFGWQRVLAGAGPAEAPAFPAEKSLSVLGQVIHPNGKPAPGAELIYMQTKLGNSFLSTTTNAEGRFLFTGLGGCDTTQLTLQARTARGNRDLLIKLDPGPPRPVRALPSLPAQASPALAEALDRSRQQRAAERKFRLDTTRSILLGNVAVKGRRLVPIDPRRLYSVSMASVLQMDAISSARGNTVLRVLQGRIAGVEVTGSEPNMSIQIRGSGSPLFVLDGVIVDQAAVSFFPASDVESIEVLKGPASAAAFGSRGAGGVISILTRRGSPNYKSSTETALGVFALRLPGFACAREFYVPRYDVASTRKEFPDLRRSTLYWNPAVQTDASGRAELTFFTADAKGNFQFLAEGISGAGQPAQGTASLRVE